MTKFNSAGSYFSLVKFSHTLFALPFALIGFTLGTKVPGNSFSSLNLFLVVVCMVLARNAAMAFNRYTDKSFDLKNPRTASREIPAGIIKDSHALLFVILNSLLFIITTFFINRICLFLSPLALLIILGYSYSKRFTSLSHFLLGIGLSLAPVGAYLAVTGKFDYQPVFFSVIVFFWVSGFDIIYALQDVEFDKENKLYSVPASIGKKNSLVLSSFLHLLSAAFILLIGFLFPSGNYYWTGAAIFIGLLLYQHLLVKPNDLTKVNIAFFTTNGIASVIFSGFVIADLLLS